jgi:hypothetical protein
MGEAKAKRRVHASILKAHPCCIYCGGIHPADTIEHMPPIAMFDGKQRPKGLEFPTCQECNNGTRFSDLVASLLGRAYPDARPDELRRLLDGVANNVPGLLEEMQVDQVGQELAHHNLPPMPPGAGVLRTNGPILRNHIGVFGAKLGLVLHYEAHRQPVPPAGGVQPMFFTNVSDLRGEIPIDLINLLPAPRTLKQGKREVSEQFRYSWALTEEGRHSFFFAVFRYSFAIGAATALDRSEFLERNADEYSITIPGDFKPKTPS